MSLGVSVVSLDPEDDRVKQVGNEDPIMRRLVEDVGSFEIRLHQDAFSGLARPIVGQQLSGGAARAIWQRMSDRVGGISAETIAASGVVGLKEGGISAAKAASLLSIARAVTSKELDFSTLEVLSDEDVADRLVQLRGVGPWTAQMFLVFTLGRLDVFPEQDAGLRRAMGALYGWSSAESSTVAMAEISSLWRPYRTVACLYLWRALDTGILP